MQYYRSGDRIAARYEVVQGPREKRSLMGGMGVVYICNDLEEDRPVALKTFKPEYLPDRAARDRFLREGTHWVELGRHPHIVRCYNVFYIDPEVYLVLELIAKEPDRDDASLRSWLIPGYPLPVETALLLALQTARGMQHVVDNFPGFVHRDLKPENLLVGADRLLGEVNVNRLRVTDFGLAHVLQERGQPSAKTGPPGGAGRDADASGVEVGRTQLTHGIAGTPLYMAPEQWRREAVSTATDVYALGCILYEMLSGQRPVTGRDLAALRAAHCEGEVRPLPGDTPTEAGELVSRCLAVEPGHRYNDWELMEAAIMDAHRAVTGRPAPSPERIADLNRHERVETGWSHNAMGISYMDLGKAEVAFRYFERAGAEGEAEGDGVLAAAALGNLGLAYAELGNTRQAIGCYERALVVACETGDRYGESNALGSLGVAYKNLGDGRQAIGYHEQALAIDREIGYLKGERNALGNLGTAYAVLGDNRRAIGCYERALAIDRQIGDWRGQGVDLGNLGSAYLQLGDARRAIDCHEQALAIAREIGDRRREATALGNLGVASSLLGDNPRAIDYYERALAIDREIGDRRREALRMMNLGTGYASLGHALRATECFQQATVISDEIGDERNAVLTALNLALLLFQ
jgi:serine/threonine protein kinase/Tfp pilus assembly protein PilF